MPGRFTRAFTLTVALIAVCIQAHAQPAELLGGGAASSPTTKPAADPVARIREEGFERSQVMATLSYLTDVIGPRVTGSPGLKKANDWTSSKFKSWGLKNAHLEPWGPFGRGWTLRKFSVQVVSPQAIPLIGYPKAWSPGLERPLTADVSWIDAKVPADLDKYRGKLRGRIVLLGPVREVQARFEPLAIRLADADLLRLANADGTTPVMSASAAAAARAMTQGERQALLLGTPMARLAAEGLRPDGKTPPATTRAAATTATTTTTTRASTQLSPNRIIDFLMKEGAAVAITPSPQGDGGTVFVAQVTLPVEPTSTTRAATTRSATTGTTTTRGAPDGPKPWSLDAPPTIPQVVIAIEQYNRMVRMIQQGVALKIALDLRVQLHTTDPMAYNTIAEIPGTDLADEIVMLGAHLDSWHTGTGATDNGAGCAVVMEAVRILKQLELRPRRTIRVALWTGEEEGLLGSKAYVAKHFGTVKEPTTRPALAGARPTTRSPRRATAATTRATTREIVRGPEYDKLNAYFNLDNGTGAIHGVYLQGNEAARPLFRKWLAPFADVGAATLSLQRAGGTDHLSFDAIGLPGFQFIQDPIEYWSRTHHSNMDVFDRIQANDLKQASVIMATFVYNAAMMDEQVPRKIGE